MGAENPNKQIQFYFFGIFFVKEGNVKRMLFVLIKIINKKAGS